MALEVATLIPVINKLIGLGLSTWKAREDADLNADDAKAIQALLDMSSAVPALFRKDPSATPVVMQHFCLVTRAFGEAFRRHWYDDPHLAPKGGLFAKLTENDAGKRRRRQIEERTELAVTKLQVPGDLPAAEDLSLVSALIGDPLNLPYYRALWDAYVQAPVPGSDEEPLIMPGAGYRQFERHFRLAYAEGLAAPAGETIRRYLLGLQGDRVELVREICLRDMAAWGSRHVFGTATEESGVPPMPLGFMYVEPNAVWKREGKEDDRRPVLDFVRELMEEHRVVVVKAHFGHGKSLSARTLSWRWAEARLVDSVPSTASWLPVFVKCAEDLMSHADDPDRFIRHALYRHAEALGLGLALDDEVFAPPPKDMRTVVLVDGLDEVALGARELVSLFRRMREKAGSNLRFVVFSRPEVLPSPEKLKDTPVLELEPFTTEDGYGNPGGQVLGWIDRWNRVRSEGSAITIEGIAERRLLKLASTPILLFMIASIWDEIERSDKPLSKGALYERFFKHIARGKHEADPDHQPTIEHASKSLCKVLVERGELEEDASPPDAMLWLLSRIAWQAKRLEDAPLWGNKARPLRERDVQTILTEEFDIDDGGEEERTLKMGVLLALQIDLAEEKPRILFGHKSFREFLIGRYWEHQLKRIIRSDRSMQDKLEQSLCGARLLEDDDKSFDFLLDLLAVWSEKDRCSLFKWAEECFNDERSSPRASRFREDSRPLLRAAALAIGSAMAEERGVRAKDPLSLRSLLAWFWLQEIYLRPFRVARLISPGAQLSRSVVFSIDLHEADLNRAHLSEANLKEANLKGANLIGADLSRANLIGANLEGADLSWAHLSEAHLIGAHLNGADLNGAKLNRAKLNGAKLNGVNLEGADLSGADLSRANLRRAHLSGADLSRANLRRAHLSGAHLSWVDLSGAHLSWANLEGADLTQAWARETERDDFAKAGVAEDMLDSMKWWSPPHEEWWSPPHEEKMEDNDDASSEEVPD